MAANLPQGQNRDELFNHREQRGRDGLATESQWDDFARTDAYTYIMTDLPRGDQQAFWQSGEITVSQELLPVIHKHAASLGTALEIGCGVGRLVLPMARHFGRVFGMDIAPEMTRQAAGLAAWKKVNNVRFFTLGEYQRCPSDFAELAGNVDFVYSLIVFQHIPDFRFIYAYLELVRMLLSTGGVAYLQFDTRPQTMPYRVKTALPDFVLPRFLRRGIRRIRRTPDELESSFANCNLAIVESLGSRTEYHRYVLRKGKS
jgi:cyclopropane fatty-acyl-phospholipid synthase-like methyltransferase